MNVVSDNPRYGIACDERVMAFVYRNSAAMTADDAYAIGRLFMSARERLVIACYTADVGARPFTPKYRKALNEVMSAQTQQIEALAMILPGTGFAHALRVSVHTGFTLIVKTPFPNRVFRDLKSSLEWFARWESVDPRMREGFALLGCPNI